MARRDRPDASGDDRSGLEAVWGREASAAAEPVEAPTVAPFAGDGGPGRRSWWPIVGAVVAFVFVAAGVVVVVSGGDEQAVEPDRSTTTDEATASIEPPPWTPQWTVPVACPRFDVTDETRRSQCSVAADDDRIYVLEERDEGTALVAWAAPSGAEAWSLPLPGAVAVERLPSVLTVITEEGVVAIDPVSGRTLWQAPGDAIWPAGRDHLLVDEVSPGEGGDVATMTVRNAATGTIASEVSGLAPDVSTFVCPDAGIVMESVGGELTGRPVEGGLARWVVTAQHHDAFDPLWCTGELAAAIEGPGDLVVRGLGDGREVARLTLAPPDGVVSVVGMVGSTVVVATSDGLRGFRATGIDLQWELLRDRSTDGAVVAPAGDGLGVALPGDVAAWYDLEGTPGPQLVLDGLDDVVVDDGRLVAWGDTGLLAAPLVDLGRSRRTDDEVVDDVRDAAVGGTFVAVTTRDRLVVYPFDP